MLEGIAAAYGRGSESEEFDRGRRVRALLLQARKELRVERIFEKEVWKEDGTWRYAVPGEEEGDVTWKQVVEAHPALGKWEKVVAGEVKKAGVGVGRFEGAEWEAGRVGGDEG